MKIPTIKATLTWTVLLILMLVILPHERMTVASYLVLFVGGGFASLGYKLSKDLASPQVILVATWGISLFLTSLEVKFSPHIGHFNTPLKADAWIMILVSIGMFYLASVLAMKPLYSDYREQIGVTYLNWNKGKVDRVIFISFVVAFTVYTYAVIRNGGLPAFSDNVNETRSSFIPGTLGVFLTLFQLVVLLTTANVLLYGGRKNRFNVLLALSSLICSFLTTQRIAAIESVLMATFIFVVLWPYTSKSSRRRRKPILLASFSVLAIGFIWLFVWIGQTRGLDALQMTDLDSLVIEQFYIYFGGPAPRNFQMIIDGGILAHINESKHSALFFRPVLWFIGFRNDVSLNDTFRGPNNATALFHYYIDLGLAGLVVIPLFWGAVVGYLYGRFRRKPSVRSGVVYVILASATYFLPLSERFSEPSTFVKIVLFSLLISLLFNIKKFELFNRKKIRGNSPQ